MKVVCENNINCFLSHKKWLKPYKGSQEKSVSGAEASQGPSFD